MKKTLLPVILSIFLLAVLVLAAKVDLSGTWKGTTVINELDETLTLILKQTGKDITGIVTDSAGYSNETDIESVKFEDNTLHFNFQVDTGSEYLVISITLKVEGNTMVGDWQSADGNSGPIEMKKE